MNHTSRTPGCAARIVRMDVTRGACRLLCMLLLLPLGGPAHPRAAATDARPVRIQLSRAPHAFIDQRNTVYLPLAIGLDQLTRDTPIWSHSRTPAAHEVALFRHTFTLAGAVVSPTLALFADTRYQVWVDGAAVGRGPARFSRLTREYDVYQLAPLAAGPHVIAVLAQWAPNIRRSESTIPFLQGHIQGTTANGATMAIRTGADWKALRSDAWREDSAPVHAWQLIGPTELLDLRKLPGDWMQVAFSDTRWAAAVPASPPAARLQPRSIALLEHIPVSATVREVGVLSPGRMVGVLDSASGSRVAFDARSSTTLIVEVLTTSETTRTITLDGAPLAWQPRAEQPGVVVGEQQIAVGPHSLAFAGPPAQDIPFSLSTQGLAGLTLPFQQGRHAGQRMLLADPVPRPDAVAVAIGRGMALSFIDTPAYAVLDLGRVVYGRVVADIDGPAGTVVDMGWDERLWNGRRPLPYPGALHPEWNQTDSWVLDGARRAITTIDARAGRYIVIAAWGPGRVRLTNLRVEEERYPVMRRGSFSSSDPLLDRIWQVGVNTLYPNMTDGYADPWRERGQWWGDAYVDDHTNQAAFGDTQLLARGIRLMAESMEGGRPTAFAPAGKGTHLLDYAMLWVQSVNDYRQRAGDTQLSVQIYPAIEQFITYLERHENRTTGLLDMPYTVWWQSPVLIDWPAHYSRFGQSAAFNAMYYGTLRDAADIADSAGNTARAQAWRRKAATLKDALNARLYRPSEGRYATTIFQGVAQPATPHAQAWTLAYDVVPDDQRQRVADSLLALLSNDPATPNVEIYGMFWVLEGLGRAGRIVEATQIIRRYYGSMLDQGATTWWENFTSNRSYTQSLSHGWGTAPTWFLTTYVLGARRVDTDGWSLRPMLSSFARGSGALPLRQGALQAAWDSPRCGEQTLRIDAPADTQGEVVIPFSGDALALTLDGAVVWRDGKALAPTVSARPNGVRIALPRGQHRLEARRPCHLTYLPVIAR